MRSKLSHVWPWDRIVSNCLQIQFLDPPFSKQTKSGTFLFPPVIRSINNDTPHSTRSFMHMWNCLQCVEKVTFWRESTFLKYVFISASLLLLSPSGCCCSLFFHRSRNVSILLMEPASSRRMLRRSLESRLRCCQRLQRRTRFIWLEVGRHLCVWQRCVELKGEFLHELQMLSWSFRPGGSFHS